MTEEECDALMAYVRSLPSPVVVEPTRRAGASPVEEGRRIFTGIGCAGCHSPDLGSVHGIYSDLLLHDMGEALSDPGVYYGTGESPGSARSAEWRTPPLWGVRDSGPYLHDGRAQTLEEVVSQHGGQGTASARWFEALGLRERSDVKAFLNSLAAPVPDELTDDAAQDNRPLRSSSIPAKRANRAEHRLHEGKSLEGTSKPEGAFDFYQGIAREAADSSSPK